MAFWTVSASEPKRKYRYLVYMDGDIVIEAKTVSKPKITMQPVEMINPIGGAKVYKPGVPTWEPITLTLVDVGTLWGAASEDSAKWLTSLLRRSGFDGVLSPGCNDWSEALKESIQIHQINEFGEPLEKWELINPMITRIDYGDLDYSSDDLLEITVEITYDRAKVTFHLDETPFFA
jgi:hypothetical protein